MRFWDSSALVPLVVSEVATKAMQAAYADDPEMVVWWATEIECVSALARRERDGLLSNEAAVAALERLDALRAAWNEITPGESLRRTARRMLRVHDLRTADALQLASALVASEDDPASLQLVVLDQRLAAAAQREGFPVVGP